MPIPDFQTLMLPFLECLRDRSERSMRDVTELLAERFKLTEEERAEHIPSGEQKYVLQPCRLDEISPESVRLAGEPGRGGIVRTLRPRHQRSWTRNLRSSTLSS